MSDADPVVRLDRVARSFGDVRALDGVTLTVGHGEVVGMLGHNGAGKTTTVRLLTGILSPDAGVVQVLGMDPQAHGPAVRRSAGVVSAVPAVDDRLTGWQNLEFVVDVFGVDRARGAQRSRELLEHGRVIADGAPAALAAQLGIGRLRLEVEPDDAARTEQLLSTMGAAAEAGTGGRLVLTSLAAIDVPALIAELVGAGVRIHQVVREDGSLEDVYFALHDRTAG